MDKHIVEQARSLISSKTQDDLASLDNLLSNHPELREVGGKLMFSARNSKKAISILLRHGIDIDAAMFRNSTALYYAVSNQNVEMARFLLENGANPNSAFILLSAIGNNRYNRPLETLKLLDEFGADLHLVMMPVCESALDRAINLEMEDVIEFLLSKGVKRGRPHPNYDSSILQRRPVPNPNHRRPEKELPNVGIIRYEGKIDKAWRATIHREGNRPLQVILFSANARPSKKHLNEAAEFVLSLLKSDLWAREQIANEVVGRENLPTASSYDRDQIVEGLSLFRLEYDSESNWKAIYDCEHMKGGRLHNAIMVELQTPTSGNAQFSVHLISSRFLVPLAADFLDWSIPEGYEKEGIADQFVSSVAVWKHGWRAQCQDFGEALLKQLDECVQFAERHIRSTQAFDQRFYRQLKRILILIQGVPRW